MSLGLGLGVQARRSAILAAFDFRSATRTGGAFTLPAWLAIACASTARTAQTSAATISKGFGANAARARSVDGSTWGLSIECARTNSLAGNETWTPTSSAGSNTTMTHGQTPDPAGGASACLFDSASGQTGQYWLSVAGRCLSTWAKWVSGTGQISRMTNQSDGYAAVGTTATWHRVDGQTSSDGSAVLFDGRQDEPPGQALLAQAQWLAYGAQYEGGKYPGSLIIGAATRAADVLSSASPALLAPGGYFDASIIAAPNYATAEQGSDHDLFFLDSNNRVFIQQSTAKVVLRIGGADVVSSALTWSRDQALSIRAVHRPNGRLLVVSGATTGDGSATGSAASAVSLPATAYLLGNASGAQECSDLRRLVFAQP